MMEVINEYIIIPYLVTFVLLTYALKDDFRIGFEKVFKKPIRNRYVVFIIATIMAVPFYVLHDKDPIKLLTTYTVGTSLYELIIVAIIERAKAKKDG